MSLVEALILGIVQGLTEFLPISSTAHLRVVPALLGWSDPGVAYSAVIQLGSVVAVIAYFGKDLLQIGGGFIKAAKEKDWTSLDVRLVAAILLGTMPICVLGLALHKLLEADNGPLRSLVVIGSASIVMGIFLLLAEKFGRRQRSMQDLGVRDGLLIGLGQALALVPGCSRSGSTLTTALLLSINREDAARFSFLLGIPAIVLSGLFEMKKIVEVGLDGTAVTNLAVGLISSAVVSYAAIWWLLSFLKSHSTAVFVGYRFLFGAVVLGLALTGHIH